MNDEGEEDLELVSKMAELYDKLGISVYNSEGELKNTFELLESLAEVYPTLTAAEKAYVTETIAGKYQAQNAAAILNNFQTALDATATAYDSTGSAAKENEKVLDSINGKLNNLKSQFEELSSKAISSDFIKMFLDLGTALLKIANLDVFGKSLVNLAPYMLAIQALKINIVDLKKAYDGSVTSMSAFNAKLVVNRAISENGITGISSELKKEIALILQQNNAYDKSSKVIKAATMDKIQNKLATEGVSTSQQALILSTIAETKATTASTAALIAKTVATKALYAALTLGLSYGISLIVEGTGKLIEWVTKSGDTFEEMSEKVSDATKNYKEVVSDIDDTISNYKKLKEELDSIGISSKDAEKIKAQLIETETNLIDKYNLEASSLDLVNGKYEEQLSLLEEIKNKEGEELLNKTATSIDDLYSQTGANTNLFGKNYIGVSGENEKILEDIFNNREWSFGDGNLTASEWLYNELSKETTKIRQEYNKAKNSGDEKAAKDLGKQLKQLVEYSNGIKEKADTSVKTLTDVANVYINGNDELKKVYDSIMGGSKNNSDYSKGKEIIDEMINNNEMDNTIGDFIKLLLYNTLKDNNSENIIKGSADEVVNETIDAYRKAFQERIDSGETLDIDNIFKDMFNTEDNGMSHYLSELYDKMKELSDSGKMTKDSIKDVIGSMDNFTVSDDDVIYGLDGTTISLDDLIKYFYQFNGVITESSKLLENFNNSLDEIENAYNTVKQAVDEYNENGYVSLDTFKELANIAPEYLEYLFDEEGQLRLNEQAFRNLAIAQLENLKVQKAQELYEYVKTLAAEGNQLDENKTKLDNLTQSLEKYNNEQAKGVLFSMVDGSFTDEELASIEARMKAASNYINLINGMIGDINSGRVGLGGASSSGSSSGSSSSKEWWEIELEKLQDQFKYNEITIEEYIKGLDNLLSRVQDGTEAWRQINEELQKQRLTKVEDDYKRGTISLDEYINKLKELIKAYRAGTDAWNDLADKIKDALQDKLDQQKDDLETAEKAAIGLIDEEIEKQEQLRDEKEEYYDKLIADKKAANEETERELELARLEEALENAKNEKTKRVEYMLSIKMAQNGETPEEDNTVGKICFEI